MAVAGLSAAAGASTTHAGAGHGPTPGAEKGGASSGQAGSGGNLNFGLEAETDNYCLSSAQLAISGIQVVAAIYDTLTVPNSKGVAVPYLAKSVTPNATNTVWTITLRPGIKFQDGEALDAERGEAEPRHLPGRPRRGERGLRLAVPDLPRSSSRTSRSSTR